MSVIHSHDHYLLKASSDRDPWQGPWDSAIQILTRDHTGWSLAWALSVSELVNSTEQATAALERRVDALRNGGELVVHAPARVAGGFDVDLRFDADYIHGTFGGLEQDFASVSLALLWLRRALSDAYHLRTVIVGGRPSEYSLEPVAGTADVENSLASGTARLFSAWRSKSVGYRQNALMRDF